jgi:hypothetical protein
MSNTWDTVFEEGFSSVPVCNNCTIISAGFRINSPLGNILVRPSEQNKRITEINENHL